MVLSSMANLVTEHTAIIGCGNANRMDDGVGPAVIRRLRSISLPDGVSLFDAGTDGMSVMYRAKGMHRLVIVDAQTPESSPGTIYKVPGEVLRELPPHSMNLHDFRWDHALYAGRQIYADTFPEKVDVFLIEAASLEMGVGLTPLVEQAAKTVAQKIQSLLSEDEIDSA